MMQQSRELMQKYHLNDVFIIPEAEQEGKLNESIARAGAMSSPTASAKTPINVGYGDTPQPNAEPSGDDRKPPSPACPR